MDMNRKSRFSLQNKKIQLAEKLLHKFVMVIAFFVMVGASAHAGAFLDDEEDEKNIVLETITLSDRNADLYNRSGSNDEWDNINDWGYTGTSYVAENERPTYYIGTFDPSKNDGGGDPKKILLELINIFLDSEYEESDSHYVKIEDKDNQESGEGLTLNVTYDQNTDPETGTWSVTSDISPFKAETINFYSVKGAQEFALYYVNPAASSGKWTTEHIVNSGGNPEISHFSIVKLNIPDIPDENPIPEPTSMLLFGFSLIGLAGLARQRNGRL